MKRIISSVFITVMAIALALQGKDADMIAEAFCTFFPQEAPSTSILIGVQSLAFPDLLIEIKATAVVD